MDYQFDSSTNNDLFSYALEDGTLLIRDKNRLLHMTKDIDAIFSFYNYIKNTVMANNFDTMVIRNDIDVEEYGNYVELLKNVLCGKDNLKLIDRLCNLFNNIVTSVLDVNAVTIYAGHGALSLLHLNTSLAYDYRIVSDGTTFSNLAMKFGIITKGSGYFLPRLLGIKKAAEVMQWETFSAEDALQLGLIDKIVPSNNLEDEAMRLAQNATAEERSSIIALRKLLKFDAADLKKSLDMEDLLIRRHLESPVFNKMISCLNNGGGKP